MVKPYSPQMEIYTWRMRIACWTTKPINTLRKGNNYLVLSRKYFGRGRALGVTYSECVSAVKCRGRIIFSSVACLSAQY